MEGSVTYRGGKSTRTVCGSTVEIEEREEGSMTGTEYKRDTSIDKIRVTCFKR